MNNEGADARTRMTGVEWKDPAEVKYPPLFSEWIIGWGESPEGNSSAYYLNMMADDHPRTFAMDEKDAIEFAHDILEQAKMRGTIQAFQITTDA